MHNGIEFLTDDQIMSVNGGDGFWTRVGEVAAGVGIGAVVVVGAVALAATAPVSIPCAAVLGVGAAASGGLIGAGISGK